MMHNKSEERGDMEYAKEPTTLPKYAKEPTTLPNCEKLFRIIGVNSSHSV